LNEDFSTSQNTRTVHPVLLYVTFNTFKMRYVLRVGLLLFIP